MCRPVAVARADIFVSSMEIDIEVRNVTKAFVIGQNILENLSFEVLRGEHVGLLGKNGAGKTTLLRMLTGRIEPDIGYATVAPSRRAGLMSQIPKFPEHFTGEDVLKDAHKRLDKMSARLHAMEEQMAHDSSETALAAYDKLRVEFEVAGGYDTERNINLVANGLGITRDMRDRPFNELSGGEQTRINLARLLLEDTDILLLDEPTNHLDMSGVEWLEEYLRGFKGTALIVSHDRYFLDQTVKRIVEIKQGRAELYNGNYSFYEAERVRRYEEQMRLWEKSEAEIKRLSVSRDRLYQWGTGNKNLMKKSFAIQSRIDRIEQVQGEKPKLERAMKVRFKEQDFRADELLVLRGLAGGYEDKPLFEDVNLLVQGGERIAILGDNGAGKTTFLNTIIGLHEPSAGYALAGPAVKMAYLPQLVSFQRPELSLYDELLYHANFEPQEARNRLGAFGFSGDDVFKPIFTLSGGEQRRLKLCILMKDDINLLVLDEPTNHLDIASREWIESALDQYGKALIFVSHDRYFIQRYANRIWEMRQGHLNEYKCGYDEYKEQAHLRDEREKQIKRREQEAERAAKAAERQQKKAADKRPNMRNLDRRIAKAEKEIALLEEQLESLAAQQEQYAADYEKLIELSNKQAEVEAALEEAMLQWEELSELMEDAERND